MVTGLVNVLFQIGMWKIALTAMGWIFGSASVILLIVFCVMKYEKHGDRADWIRLATAIFLFILSIGCISIYVSPIMNEPLVMAKHVAPLIDEYAEKHPDSIYNKDVLLGAGSDAVLGLVGTATELPKYLAKFAEGGIQAVLPKKSLSEMTPDEIRKLTQEEYNRLKNQ